MYINWFAWIIFINDCVIQKIGGNENSSNDLNIMVNYHYHNEKSSPGEPVNIYIQSFINIIQENNREITTKKG